MTKEFKIFTFAVHNTLGIGHKNAMTRKELCDKLKCSDRILRRAIEELRKEYPILTRDDGNGYYLATTDEDGVRDALSWIKRQNRRMRSIRESEAGAARFIKNKNIYQIPGQLNMFGGAYER